MRHPPISSWLSKAVLALSLFGASVASAHPVDGYREAGFSRIKQTLRTPHLSDHATAYQASFDLWFRRNGEARSEGSLGA